jgi:UDP-GlcNAc:undecaprenyl-phosphate GlcNAc-1-phosphate transferase
MWISNDMKELLWVAGRAFIVALVLTPIVRDIFHCYGVVDRPGRRKVHDHPIPRVGGISIAVAYSIALFFFLDPKGLMSAASPQVWRLFPGAALVFLTGLADDFFGLRPVYKLAGQAAAAGLVYWSGLRLESIAQIDLPPWLSLPLTLFWLLLTINAFNLIDGLDGLCAGVGLLATLTMFGAALLQKNLPLVSVTFPLVGALLGFLCYNLKSATIFLGDSGAMLIGFLLGCYGMIWTEKTTTLLSMTVPLLALSVPLLDVSLSVLRRFLRNQPVFTADRDHIHHHLLARGLSPFHVVLALYLVTSVAALFALLAISPAARRYQNLVIVASFAALWVGIRKLQYAELRVAGRLLFGGELQKTINVRLLLDRLIVALERAQAEDEWWGALIEAAKDFGWSRVKWTTLHRTWEQSLRGDCAGWRLELLLSDDEIVRVEGPVPAVGPRVDLHAFSEIIHRGAAARQRRLAEHALP